MAGFEVSIDGRFSGVHRGDAAITELSKAEQQDPFVSSLLAQAYELNKNPTQARELYARILIQRGHSLQAAFAMPLARRKMAQ